MKALFQQLPLAAAVLPEPEELSSLDLAGVQKIQRELLVPNNAVLVVVGAVEPAPVFRQVMAKFGALVASPLTPTVPAEDPAMRVKKIEGRDYLDIKTVQVDVTFEAPGLCDPDAAAAILWETALGDANDNWLQRFEQEFPGVRNTRLRYQPMQGRGTFSIGFESQDPAVDQTVATLLARLADLHQTRVEGAELQRLINVQRTRISTLHETRMGLAIELASAELAQSCLSATGVLTALRRVTGDDMARVARRIFSESRYAIHLALPLACREATPGEAVSKTLGNGMRLAIKPSVGGDLAAIAFQAAVPVASEAGGARYAAAAQLFEHLLGQGAVRAELDQIGAGLTVVHRPHNLFVIGSAERRHLPALARLMTRLLVQDPWSEGALARAREVVSGRVSEYKEVIYLQVVEALGRELFEGLPVMGLLPDEPTVRAIGGTELQDLRRALFAAANLNCVITGNVDLPTVAKDIEPLLAALPGGKRLPGLEVPARLIAGFPGAREVEVTLPNRHRSGFIAFAYRFPTVGSLAANPATAREFAGISVVFHLLTWSRNGLVVQALREKSLLEDVVALQLSNSPEAGWMFAVFQVPHDRLAEARAVVGKVLASLNSVAVVEGMISAAARTVRSHFLATMERTADRAAVLASFMGVGFEITDPTRFRELYRQVTVADVKTVIDKYCRNHLLLVVSTR